MEMPTRRALEDQRRKGSVGGWWRVRMVSTVDGQGLGHWGGEGGTLQAVGVAWTKVRRWKSM